MLERYWRAEQIQNVGPNRWFLNTVVISHWISNTNRFWFKEETVPGYRFTVVDIDKRRSTPAFDHRKLADRLADATEREVDADKLPVFALEFKPDSAVITFEGLGKQWSYDTRRNKLEETGVLDPPGTPAAITSPDGSKALFRRDHNLWVRDQETQEEVQLTTDGAQYYSYGRQPDATGRAATTLEAVWSPNSTKILTHQTDDRQVGEMPMVNFAPQDGSFRPQAFAYRTSLPGDEHVTTFRMTVIDVESKKQTAALYQPLVSARMMDTPISGNRAWWSADSTTAYFVDIERFEKTVHVVEFDTATGRTRKLFTESNEEGYVELGSNVYTAGSLRPLPETNELIWYSERSGWAHLYLYNLATGELVRQLTDGEWLVRDVLGVDVDNREVFISRGEYDASIDPYYRQIARVNIDTAKLTPLSGGDADHFVMHVSDFGLLADVFLNGTDPSDVSGLSPGGDYYVEMIQRVDRLPKTVVRDRNGNEIMTIVEPDTSRVPDWFSWPEPVQLTAADGETTVSAIIIRPSDFSPDQKYPVIDHIYGGPQVSNVPEVPNTMTAIRSAALAELGFISVVIDGRGTAERSRAFHESSSGAAHTASNLEDHIAAIEELAEKYSYIDSERVGIFGFSGGGYMTANAMVRFPDFFDVGVAGAGNHDQRLFWSTWGERYHGALDGDNYASQASTIHAENLKGKLLFQHGLMDFAVHPSALFQLTQALIAANKDFDLMLLPQAAHSSNGWAERRLWGYFLEHLAGEEPLEGYELDSVFEWMEAAGKETVALRYGLPPEPGPETTGDAGESE